MKPTQLPAKAGVGGSVELGKKIMLSILRQISNFVLKWL